MATGSPVSFWYGTRAQFDSITTKLDTTLYFITDEQALYKGSVKFSGSGVDTLLTISSTQPSASSVTTGDKYFNTSDNLIHVLKNENGTVTTTATYEPANGALYYNADAQRFQTLIKNGSSYVPTEIYDAGISVEDGTGLVLNGTTVGGLDATTNSKGVVQVGTNLNVSNGVISVPTATNARFGVVQTGDNVTNMNGVISVAKATTSSLGVVKPGDNINVDNNGQISVPVANGGTKGVVSAGENVNNNNGVLSVSTASTGSKGVIKIADPFSCDSSGILTIGYASATNKGVVKVGTNIDVADGVISVKDASTSDKGVVQLVNDASSSDMGSETRAITPHAVGQIVTALNNKIDEKQDKLSAGAWIEFDGNVISTSVMKTMTTAERTAITPEAGQFIYDTDEDALYVGDGVTAGGIPVGSGGGGGGTIGDNLVIPDKFYAVVGREANIYYDNLYKCPSELFCTEINASSGMSQNERYTYTPSVNGELTIHIRIRNLNDFTLLASKDVTLYVATESSGAGKNIKLSLIGDSLTFAGKITQTLLDIASDDAMGIALIGLRGEGSNKYEGQGGWTIANYTSGAKQDYKFTVSGVTTPPPTVNYNAWYTSGGSKFRVVLVDLTDGAGTMTCELVSGSAPSGSGTLTKAADNPQPGDATISFSAVEPVPANPFWFNGAVDYSSYLSSNSFSTPDFVFIQLGTNDVMNQTSDEGVRAFCQTAFANYDTLIASIQDAGVPYIGLMLCPPPAATQDAFGALNGASLNRNRVKRNFAIWDEEMLAKWSDSEEDGIFIVPSNTAIDTYHNFQFASSSTANSRTAMTVTRQNNSVHPATSGYQQIADCLWAFLKSHADLVDDRYSVTVTTGTSDGSLYYGLTTPDILVVGFSTRLNGQTVSIEGATVSNAKQIVGNGVNKTYISGTVTPTSDTQFVDLSMAGVTVTSGGVMRIDSGVVVASGTELSISGATVDIYGGTIAGTIGHTNGAGNVYIHSGAIVDLTGNANATPVSPGGILAFPAGGATVYPSAGSASAMVISGATVTAINNAGGVVMSTGIAFDAPVAFSSCNMSGAATGARYMVSHRNQNKTLTLANVTITSLDLALQAAGTGAYCTCYISGNFTTDRWLYNTQYGNSSMTFNATVDIADGSVITYNVVNPSVVAFIRNMGTINVGSGVTVNGNPVSSGTFTSASIYGNGVIVTGQTV